MREKRATASDRLKPSRWMCVSRQFLCEVSRSRRCEGTAAGSSLQTPAEARRSRSPCRPCAGSEKHNESRVKKLLMVTAIFMHGYVTTYCILDFKDDIRNDNLLHETNRMDV